MTTDNPLAVREPSPMQVQASAAPQHGILSLPIGEMNTRLAEYTDKRKAFRKWLLSNMSAGVHYGTPPGCEPKTNSQGQLVTWDNKPIYEDQWRAKPCLYKAGAELLCDLLQMRDKFTATYTKTADIPDKRSGVVEVDAWVVKCELFNRASGELVGEGNGVFCVGEKKMGANSALKMAEKRAKVDAVLNTLGISDLFTQDIDPEDKDGNPKKTAAPATITEAQADILNGLIDTIDHPALWPRVQALAGVQKLLEIPAAMFTEIEALLQKTLAAKRAKEGGK